MVPVMSSKAQRVLEVSLAGNLIILEEIARRQSAEQRASVRYCDHRLSHCLPMSQLYCYGISCWVRNQCSYPKGSKHLP